MLVRIVNMDSEADQLGEMIRQRVLAHMTPVIQAAKRSGAGLGIGPNSCNAAVVLDLSPDNQPDSFGTYEKVGFAGRELSLLYGNSRLFTGLDDVALSDRSRDRSKITAHTPSRSAVYEEHAEQIAIRTAEQRALPCWRDDQGACHVFGSLDPCKNCNPWLGNRGERWVYHVGRMAF